MTYEEFMAEGGSGSAFLDPLYGTFRNRDWPRCALEFAGLRWFSAIWMLMAEWACAEAEHRHHVTDYEKYLLRNRTAALKIDGKIERYTQLTARTQG